MRWALTPRRLRTVGLLVTLVLGLIITPRPAAAQQAGKVYRIGWLSPTLTTHDAVTPFLEKFRTLGWVEGKHFRMEQRFAPPGEIAPLADLAADLVKHNVDLIVAVSTPGSLAAQQATTTLPIVMAGIGDPVASGLVDSLARPGGNITGLTARPIGWDLLGKQLELLKEAVPGITRVGLLWNPKSLKRPPPAKLRAIVSQWQAIAQGVRLTIIPMIVFEPREYADAFATFTRERADALLVFATFLNVHHRQRIVDFATTQRVPTIARWSGFVEAGGFMWVDW